MSRPTVTEPLLYNVNGNKETAELRGAMEQRGRFAQRCQDMTRSSSDCNYQIPERGNGRKVKTVTRGDVSLGQKRAQGLIRHRLI